MVMYLLQTLEWPKLLETVNLLKPFVELLSTSPQKYWMEKDITKQQIGGLLESSLMR